MSESRLSGLAMISIEHEIADLEGNNDEANRCIEIAVHALTDGKLKKVDKFVPSQRAKDLLAKVRSAPSGNAKQSSGKREAKAQSKWTQKLRLSQCPSTAQAVRKIKKCKDYYDVLDITEEATDTEIKKSYKKFALHCIWTRTRRPAPPKSSSQKRKAYDLYGINQPHNGHGGHNGHTATNYYNNDYGCARGFQADVSAVEIFNVFCGGGYPQQNIYMQQTRRRRRKRSSGYGRIGSTNSCTVFSKLRGTTQALYVLAVVSNTRFEFLFTDVSGDTNRKNAPIFASIFEICQLYQRTYLYRDLKLRGAIILSGQLIIMPQERVYSNVNGVWNLSSDQGNLGCFVVTNIRLVWYADATETFNISLPHLQIANIRIRESKYGPALVVQTTETGGGYVLRFRIDPADRLYEIFKELISLHAIYSENPNFGVQYNSLEAQQRNAIHHEEELKIEEFQEIDEKQEREIYSKLNTYLVEGCVAPGCELAKREPVYCKELGFAMERIRDGYKLKDLWDVLPTILAEDD